MEQEVTYTLPSPSDTPYRTPSSTRSRRSHPSEDMSPSSTPPPQPEDSAPKRRSNESVNQALDENISPLDPRRFTPTLHASLVSEILSLRRDLESRTSDIENLEQSLHQAQSQNEGLNSSLLTSSKETRSLKRQMQLLEGGTLSALNELAKERDDAMNDVADLRRRLDISQKRAKSQEENAEKTQTLWDKEKESWSIEKRALDTRVQIAEGRLKVVLSEIANAENNARSISPERSELRNSHSRNSLLESPGKNSITGRRGRRHSATSINSDHAGGRMSVLSFANGLQVNLADELAFDEEEENHFLNGDYHENGRVSPDALPEENIRPASSLSIKARKILGLPIDLEEFEKRDNVDPFKSSRGENGFRESANYVDTAIQFSPPPSPWPRSESRLKRHSHPADLQLDSNRQSFVGPVSPTESIDSSFAPWNAPAPPLMVSAGCQTVEALPSPPPTPEKPDAILATIHESAVENIELTTSGTQTEPVQIQHKPLRTWQHVSTESRELQIPTINIVPPGSRPTTPETSVALPPRTKNASCQVNLLMLGIYSSSSMQTEEIRVDKRAIMGPAAMYPIPPAPLRAPVSSRIIAPMLRRKTSPGTSMFGSQRMNVGLSRMPAGMEGSSTRDSAQAVARPNRTSSLPQGLADVSQDDEGEFDGDTFEEDDIFSRPTAKFTLRSGKMINQDLALEDIGESTAAVAGEAAALDILRMSEENMPAEMKAILAAQGRISPRRSSQRPAAVARPIKRVPSLRSTNMRRAALISSGAAAHQSSNSQSTNASFDSQNPPPFPVPLRYSSARITKSMSEGGRSSRASSTASPTKLSKHSRKHILRKSRSGPAISPHAQARKGRSGSQSPPVDPRVSIVPEMPSFQMPVAAATFLSEPYVAPREASAPRPSVATGPNRKASHIKTNSDALSMHQTSVVDSIAQTMVGEWMYKYVRRRKSFGVTDKSNDWDPNKSVDELSANNTNGGLRHKRWVWLAPYERAVMWSSKQPTSGTALMGKSGRKLTIKSVLDVKDDNPMPKGSIPGNHFNRSILILTPQRALKFTATSQERHFVWLTALSFLSHSPLSVNDLAPMPPPPQGIPLHQSDPPSLAGSLRRRPIRDSIRIAKGGRPTPTDRRSFTTDGSLPVPDVYERPPSRDYYDPTIDPAQPPTIKRFHTRKRSNTAPRAPPNSFRPFSTRDSVPSHPGPGPYAGSGFTGSDRGLYTPSLGVQSRGSSRRGSEASASGRPVQPPVLPEFAPSNATMRMDAFMETRNMPPPAPPRGGPLMTSLRGGTLRKKDMGYWGIDEGRWSISPVDSLAHSEMMATADSNRASVESRDPFRGF